MASTYTRSTLVPNEKVLFEAHLHLFCYLPSILVILVGVFLFVIANMNDIKKLSERVDKQAAQQVSQTLAKAEKEIKNIQENIEREISTATKSLPISTKSLFQKLGKLPSEHIGVILMFLGFIHLIKTYIKKHTSEFVVTTHKIAKKQGFIAVNSTEISLEHVEGVGIKQSLFDRLVLRGDIVINGNGLEQIKIARIYDPFNFHRSIIESVEKYANH